MPTKTRKKEFSSIDSELVTLGPTLEELFKQYNRKEIFEAILEITGPISEIMGDLKVKIKRRP